MVILDGTSFPKQGHHSVGVARQYCGALGKVANCQVAVTVALWTGVRAYLLGAALYLPEAWLTAPARAAAKIPASVRGQPRWRQALAVLRQVQTSDFTVTGVVADAEFGDPSQFRAAVHRMGLPYAVGISSTQTVFVGRPRLVRRPVGRRGRPPGPMLPEAWPPSRWPPWPRRSRAGARSAGATAPPARSGRCGARPCG